MDHSCFLASSRDRKLSVSTHTAARSLLRTGPGIEQTGFAGLHKEVSSTLLPSAVVECPTAPRRCDHSADPWVEHVCKPQLPYNSTSGMQRTKWWTICASTSGIGTRPCGLWWDWVPEVEVRLPARRGGHASNLTHRPSDNAARRRLTAAGLQHPSPAPISSAPAPSPAISNLMPEHLLLTR